MAIQTGKYKKRKEESKAARSIADALERERGEEGIFQGVMQTANPLISMATKWGGEKILEKLTTLGLGTVAPYLKPLIYAYSAYQTKKGIEKFARSQGAGGEPEEIVADNRFGFGKESAKTYRKGMEQTIEEFGPNIYADVASSYLSSVTPKFDKAEEEWVSGDLIKAYEDGFKLKDLWPVSFRQGGQVPKYEHGGIVNEYAEDFESPESAVSGLETMSGKKLSDLLAWKLNQAFESESPTWDGHPDRSGLSILDIIGGLGEGKEIKDKWTPGWDDPQIGGGGIGGSMQPDPEKMQGLMAFLQRLLPGGKTGMKEKEYAGGGMVESTPTIVDYFSKQGKTLGGSNQQSLAEILGR